MNILQQIVATKKHEIQERKSLFPTKLLEKSTYFKGKPVSLVSYLRRPDKIGVIAEFKRKSPSKGVINGSVSIEKTSIGYMQAGASGLSILTDQTYFGGLNDDLTTARDFNFCPILRKDFVIDEYQIIEAKSIGADVILLIAGILNKEQIYKFANLAKGLGMEVLLEVHNEAELVDCLCDPIDLVGVNNRDLKVFKTSVDTSVKLSDKIPNKFLKISESGINDAKTVDKLMKIGYEGFLVGEFFMKHGEPERACAEFILELKMLSNS